MLSSSKGNGSEAKWRLRLGELWSVRSREGYPGGRCARALSWRASNGWFQHERTPPMIPAEISSLRADKKQREKFSKRIRSHPQLNMSGAKRLSRDTQEACAGQSHRRRAHGAADPAAGAKKATSGRRRGLQFLFLREKRRLHPTFL